MTLQRSIFLTILCLVIHVCCFAAIDNTKVLNIYVWYNEIPASVIAKFEKETGIHVHYDNYDDNEILYAKLKADPDADYDIVEPSSDYLTKMSQEGMLLPLNKQALPNFKNIETKFQNPSYDPDDTYSIPYMWGVTGIFVNKQFFNPKLITRWKDLWNPRYRSQLMLLNDPRNVFSMSLLSLGLMPDSANSTQLKLAYQNLLQLLPNIKLFNSDAIPSMFIDEDATIGMAWNGDIYRAEKENPELTFIYPKDGFVIWVDCMAIPKNAPHLQNAYKFLNFLMEPQNASQVTKSFGFATANAKAKQYLPKAIQQNTTIFPSAKIISHGVFETMLNNKTLQSYANYWELLKLNG